MADIALGQVLKSDVWAIPRSTLLYACAGLFGAVFLTALELGTKVENVRPPHPQVTIPASRDLVPSFATPPEPIDWIDMDRASIAFSKSFEEFQRIALWNKQNMTSRASGLLQGQMSSLGNLWGPYGSLESRLVTVSTGVTPRPDGNFRLSAGIAADDTRAGRDRDWSVMVFGNPHVKIAGQGGGDGDPTASISASLSSWKSDMGAVRFIW